MTVTKTLIMYQRPSTSSRTFQLCLIMHDISPCVRLRREALSRTLKVTLAGHVNTPHA